MVEKSNWIRINEGKAVDPVTTIGLDQIALDDAMVAPSEPLKMAMQISELARMISWPTDYIPKPPDQIQDE
ncbi:hypothetical protein Tco_0795946 [Tanacetum coccineum]